jgi:hypothetical protein
MVCCGKESKLACPEDGLPLEKTGEGLYVCPNGHLYKAEYQFGSEEVECTFGPFKFGTLPELTCTLIKIGIVVIGIAVGVSVIKLLLGGREERRRIVIYA